jgi:ketosteroid isomerase-like protein
MQSDETLRKLSALDRELIERRVRAMLEMRAAGDLRGMLDYAAEDIVYNLKGSWASFPYASPVCGKKMVAQALAIIAMQFENMGFVIHELVIEGNQIALRRSVKLRHRGTGKVGNVDIADFLRFRDGLVVEFTEVADSIALTQLEES